VEYEEGELELEDASEDVAEAGARPAVASTIPQFFELLLTFARGPW
jgi:hypothetical protein